MSDPVQPDDPRLPHTASALNAEPVWNLLGLRIGRKTEIIALVAFILSLSGLVWQIMIYMRGAVVRLFPTDQIVFTSASALGRNYAGQENLLSVIATMSYVNDGETGQNAVIRREYISVTLGKRKIEHRWYEFGSSDLKDGTLEFKRDSEARPFPVAAASAASHETLFAPWEIDCTDSPTPCTEGRNFLTWSDFVAAVKVEPHISVLTRTEVYPSKQVTASCEVRLRSWEIESLNKSQWLVTACIDSADSDRSRVKARQASSREMKN